MKYSTTEGYPPLLDEKLQRDIDAARGVKPALQRQEGGDHYKGRAIQPIEYIHANGLGFIEGSIVKYITRWRDKGGKGDLLKIKHYVDLLIDLEGKREINPAPQPKNGAPIHDGWVEWHGGENPVGNNRVEYKLRGFGDQTWGPWRAGDLQWDATCRSSDIVAYRAV